jgi:cystathionine gamma-synthase
MKFNTLAVHAGSTHTSGSIAPDIVLSTTFERHADGTYPAGHVYTRQSNPNRSALETALARLENAAHALAFASGLAAVTAILHTLSPGDHVIIPDDVYHGTRSLMAVFPGIVVDNVDLTDPAQLSATLRDETRLVWIETPSNPALKITDIQAITDRAKAAGALCVVDNTWCTPVIQRPLDFGADVVMYSTTKYFGGHSDVLGGALCLRDDALAERLREIQTLTGGVPAPFDCWLLLRSLPTLALRLREQTRNAATIAAFLQAQPGVHAVYYPGLESHPGHALAARQMPGGFGAMLSFRVAGGGEGAARVANAVRLIRQATSLGGVETLIEARGLLEGPHSPTPPDLLRLSVGIEDADDLTADLAQAL